MPSKRGLEKVLGKGKNGPWRRTQTISQVENEKAESQTHTYSLCSIFSQNNFTGTIPTLTGHSQLYYMYVPFNLTFLNQALRFSCFISSNRDLSENSLTGTIPSLETLSQLQYLLVIAPFFSSCIQFLTSLFCQIDISISDRNHSFHCEPDKTSVFVCSLFVHSPLIFILFSRYL